MKEHFLHSLCPLLSYEARLLSSRNDFLTNNPVHLQLNERGHLHGNPVGFLHLAQQS
jgi:hypothetical protein